MAATELGRGQAEEAPFAEEDLDKSDPAKWADGRNSYWLSRQMLYRGTGVLYTFAFLVHLMQGKAMYGENGVTPADPTASRYNPAFGVLGVSDVAYDIVGAAGALCGLAMAGGVSTALLPLIEWVLYLSIVNLNIESVQGFGWEWQILELGFLIIFLTPLELSLGRTLVRDMPPSYLVICLLRWFSFRFYIGTGMSKIGGNASACWHDLSCTLTHYETQPMPNPIAWYMHNLPAWVHKIEGVIVLFAEVVVPWLMLVPMRPCRLFAGVVCGFLLVCIGTTGNYALVHPVSLVPLFSLLDDAAWARVLPQSWTREAMLAEQHWRPGAPGCFGRPELWTYVRGWTGLPMPAARKGLFLAHAAACVYLGGFILQQSVAPLKKTFGPNPWLQTYSPYYFVNSYGLFGFINKERYEVVYELQDPDSREWVTLDFRCIPGTVERSGLCVTAPFHYRFDWMNWIETTASWEQLIDSYGVGAVANSDRGWSMTNTVPTALAKVLAGDTQAGYLVGNPFPNNKAPLAIRGRLYRYEFTTWAERGLFGPAWKRTLLGDDLVFNVDAWDPQFGVSRRSPDADWLLVVLALLAASTLPHDQEAAFVVVGGGCLLASVVHAPWAYPTLWLGGLGAAGLLKARAKLEAQLPAKLRLEPRKLALLEGDGALQQALQLAAPVLGLLALSSAVHGAIRFCLVVLVLLALYAALHGNVSFRGVGQGLLGLSAAASCARVLLFVPPVVAAAS